MLRAAALSLLCVLAALVAGCGDSEPGATGSAASLVPADAELYVEATIRPEGELRDDALAAAGKIMGTADAATELQELFDKALKSEGLTWERDFAPWVGGEVGVWAASLDRPEPSYAVIVAAKDEESAESAVRKLEEMSKEDGPYTTGSVDGVDYRVDADGVAGGVVDDFVVIGTEDAFKRTVAAREGSKLADADRYEDVVGQLEEDRLAHIWVDSKGLTGLALQGDPAAAAQLEQFRSALKLDELGPAAMSFHADGDGLVFDSLSTGLGEGAMRELSELFGFAGTDLLGELPGDAWGAWAIPQVGEAGKQLLSSFAGALGGIAISGQIKQATGLDLDQDVFSWVGDVGVFVRGARKEDVDGAIVLEATDDARAKSAFGKLVALAGKETGVAPEPVRLDGAESAFAIGGAIVARGPGRVVAAYGEDAARAALEPETKLGDSELHGTGEELLDMEPAFLLSIESAIALADASGLARDSEFQQVRPYLEALGVVAGGGELDGDNLRSRIGISLK